MVKVSVVIACYNAETFLSKSVHSVLNQTHTDLECIVVDDASTDSTPQLLLEMAKSDSRIVPVFQDRNQGPAAARNRAIDIATGDFIALLDADDTYAPERLERLVSLAREKKADVVVDNQSVRHFGEDVHLYKAFDFLPEKRPRYFSQEAFMRYSFRVLCLDVGYMKPMFSTSFLRQNRLRYDERLRLAEDFEFYVRVMALNPRFFGIDYCGYNYYIRPGSLSNFVGGDRTSVAGMSDDIINSSGAALSKRSIEYLKTRKRVFLQMDRWKRIKSNPNVGFRQYLDLIREPSFLLLVAKNAVLRRAKAAKLTL